MVPGIRSEDGELMAATDELNIVISADTGNAAQNISNTANELNKLGESAKTTDSDMSALVRAMSEVAANMVSVSQNISVSASGIAGFHNGFDALSGILQDISTKFDTLNVSIQNTSFGDAASRVAELSAASEASTQALNGISAAADEFGVHMGTISDATKGSADGMDALTNGLNGALSSIRNFSGDMNTAGAEAQETAAKIKELSERINKIPKGNNVADLTKSFRTLKGVIATLGIGAFIKQSNDAYNVQMQNELKLTSHMKHRMNATDDEIRSIKELASEQQKLGVIGDEIQLAGAQQLTTYARQASTLKALIPAMNNLIAQNAGYEASVGDATSAADTLGRALNGQYTALQRQGVYFTKAQEQVLKYGTEEQKAIVLADAINSKVGNMNQLLAQTPTGQLKQLQNDFGDLQEEIGATFQPLISSFVPIVRGGMEMLREPIKNVSVGIAVLGSALARLDSPAVRAIALTAAGIAVVNKLRLALGGTTALLLVAGVLLSGFIGSMQEEQASIGDYVNNAFNGAQDAIGGAEESMSDFKDEVNDTQKAVNRLAGFDTLTKLSGGSTGSIVAGLIGDGDIDKIYEATKAASGLGDALKGTDTSGMDFSKIDWKEIPSKIDEMLKRINWDEIRRGASEFVSSINWATIFNTISEGLRTAGKLGLGLLEGVLIGIGDWVRERDWDSDFIDIGNAFEGVMSAALYLVDGLFDTHLQTWYEKTTKKYHEIGAKIANSLNLDDEGVLALEQYETQNGSSAWVDFLNLYQSGMKPEDAFNQIYNTEDLKKGFFAANANLARAYVKEWDNLDVESLSAHLDPQYYIQSQINDVVKATGPLQRLSEAWDMWTGISQMSGKYGVQGAYADIYGDELEWYKQQSLTDAGIKPSRYDVPLSPTGIPSYVPKDNITVNLNVDGETLATKTIDIQNNETVESNGYYG